MSTRHIECANLFDAESIMAGLQETFIHVEFVNFSCGTLTVACME